MDAGQPQAAEDLLNTVRAIRPQQSLKLEGDKFEEPEIIKPTTYVDNRPAAIVKKLHFRRNAKRDKTERLAQTPPAQTPVAFVQNETSQSTTKQSDNFFSPARSQFAKGQLHTTLELLSTNNSKEATLLKKEVEKFVIDFDSASTHYETNRASTALPLLINLKARALDIGKKRDDLAIEISNMLADMYYMQAIQFILANHEREAIRDLRNAVAESNHNAAQAKLDHYITLAERDLNEAESLAVTNPLMATKLLDEVIASFGANHPLGKRAQSLKKRMN